MFQVDFKKEEDILHVRFSGEVGIYELLSCIRNLEEGVAYPGDVCLLQDFRSAVFCFKPSEISLVGNVMRSYVAKNRTVKVASVYSNPRETAYGQLMERYSEIKNYYHKIFQSEEAAAEWLQPVIVRA